MRTVLVGGAGFIGSHLARALVDAGHEVTVLDRQLPGRLAPQWSDVHYEACDVLAMPAEDLTARLLGADRVYHLAWRALPESSNQNILGDVETNLLGTLRLLDACVAAKVGRVIFFSSGGTVYGRALRLPIPETHPTEPTNAHAINKLAVEKWLSLYHRLHDLEYIVLRPANPFGPYQDPGAGQGVIAAFLKQIGEGRPLEVWGDGSIVRDYFYVADLAKAAVLAGELPQACDVYNIGSGVGRSIKDLIAALSSLVGFEVPVRWLPGRSVDVPENVLDIGKAREILGWRPQVPFEEALCRTWAAHMATQTVSGVRT